MRLIGIYKEVLEKRYSPECSGYVEAKKHFTTSNILLCK